MILDVVIDFGDPPETAASVSLADHDALARGRNGVLLQQHNGSFDFLLDAHLGIAQHKLPALGDHVDVAFLDICCPAHRS